MVSGGECQNSKWKNSLSVDLACAYQHFSCRSKGPQLDVVGTVFVSNVRQYVIRNIRGYR